MNLEMTVMNQMKEAMKAKDEAALRGLRAIKAEIIRIKTAPGSTGEISPESELKLLQKMVKQRRESLELFVQQNRPDLAQKEQEELAVIEAFLPNQLTEAEIKEVVVTIIAEVGASSPADLGKVMGQATRQLAGKADGKVVASVAKELLVR